MQEDCTCAAPQEACCAAAVRPGWAPLTTQSSEACQAPGEGWGGVASSSPAVQGEKKYLHLKTSVGPGGASHSRPFLPCSATDFANGHQTLLWTLCAAVHRLWSVHLDSRRGAHGVQAAAAADQEQIQAAVLAPHQPGERAGGPLQCEPSGLPRMPGGVRSPTSHRCQVPRRTAVA